MTEKTNGKFAEIKKVGNFKVAQIGWTKYPENKSFPYVLMEKADRDVLGVMPNTVVEVSTGKKKTLALVYQQLKEFVGKGVVLINTPLKRELGVNKGCKIKVTPASQNDTNTKLYERLENKYDRSWEEVYPPMK